MWEYEKEDILEKTTEYWELATLHYLPHRPVVKENREISKVRILFDASSKYEGKPSINESLESRPCLLPVLYGIFFRFRLGPMAITADIKQAFLQISDLRFLWFDNIFDIDPSIILYRITSYFRSSPFC